MPVFSSDILSKVSVKELTYRSPYWDDLKIVTGAFWKVGASDPNELTWLTNLALYEFNTGEELHFSTQLPHDYKEGTDITPHIHWTPHTRGVAEDTKTVNWRAEITVQDIDGVFVAGTVYDMTSTCDGVDQKHLVEYATADIDGSSLKISAEIVGRIYRLAGDTWVTNTATNRPALLELDFHYQLDTPGSRQVSVK